MIISRTPYRVSFFGGGTDYPVWYRQYGGAVLATTINKYCYITCRALPPFFNHKHSIVWSELERPDRVDQIKHPAVRESLKFMDMADRGMEIHHVGDLPARSGLGTSSSFTVGLLNGLHALKGNMASKRQLATEAITIEHDWIKENVGVQDQISAAHGGFNVIEFMPDGDYVVRPVVVTPQRLDALQDHLQLFFTGISRTASHIAGDKIKAIPRKTASLDTMRRMVDDAVGIVTGSNDITDFGELLHESWVLKRGITKSVSTPLVDSVYESARSAGAIGGKLLGAGGGGFMLLFTPPEQQESVRNALSDLVHIPFRFERDGSSIILYEPENTCSDVEPPVVPPLPLTATQPVSESIRSAV